MSPPTTSISYVLTERLLYRDLADEIGKQAPSLDAGKVLVLATPNLIPEEISSPSVIISPGGTGSVTLGKGEQIEVWPVRISIFSVVWSEDRAASMNEVLDITDEILAVIDGYAPLGGQFWPLTDPIEIGAPVPWVQFDEAGRASEYATMRDITVIFKALAENIL